MRSPRRTLLALLTATVPFVPIHAQQTLTPYDVFVFRDYRQDNTETNGRIAIGLNGTFDHWGVGALLPTNYADYSLVVGGSVLATEGSVFAGKTYVGGTLSGTNIGFPAAYPPEIGGPSPVDFASETARLTALSNGYASLTSNGTVQFTGDQLQFVGNNFVNVFNVTMAMLQAGTGGYWFVSPFGTTNIVNVLGTSTSSAFNNTGFFFDCTDPNDQSSCQSGTNQNTPADAGRTLWNFNQQTALYFGGPVHGSILAPNADATFGYGDVVGTVVVGSARSNAEFYSSAEFIGPTPTAVPEPATLGLVAIGLVGLAGFARRKNR